MFRQAITGSICGLLLVVMSTARAAQKTGGKPLAGYTVVVVEKATVAQSPETAKFPAGYDERLQQKVVEDLQKKRVFEKVIDAAKKADDGAGTAAGEKRLTLSTTIIRFDPGNTLLRHTVGWGAGAVKVKAAFVFRDDATGQEIFRTTKQGRFIGFVEVYGTGTKHSVNEASGDVVDALIREILKNR
ncbi:MAG TPA: DUF4410 domain-containing protein [Blastocatellia bacterium]|nr:DUF4410 domain-containing protein [Blastocatellia bacterium]